MSTTNIPGLNAQRAAARKTASNVRGRATQIRKDLDDLEKEKNDVRVAAAAMLEDIANDEDPLLEEAEELTRILGAGSATPAQPAAAAPVAPAQPATPAAPVVVPPVVQQTPPPVTPAPAATVVQPTTPAAAAPATPRRRFFSTGGWNRWDWVFAVIFAFVAFFIGRETRDWFADLFEFSGKPETALHIFWWVLLPFLGFFTGGWFGSSMVTKFNTWRTNRRASRQTP